MEEFPPNSRKAEQRAAKRVERVTSADAVQRRKPLGKQFKSVFFGGDGRSAITYAFEEVFLPSLRDNLFDTIQSSIERTFYGDRRSRKNRRPGFMTDEYRPNIPYNRMANQPRRDDRPPLPKMLSRRNRSTHDFGDILITSRTEAEEVIDRLFDLVSKYDSASVADLYELTGIESTHTDHKWGWKDLRGARVGRTRNGSYVLDLPEPEYFE